MKPNKQNIINDILIELEKGVGYKECFGLIQTKLDIVRSTFSNYWKEANEQYKNKQETINKELLSIDIENKKEVLKTTNLTKIDRILIAESIAMAYIYKVTPNDQLKALEYLGKIHGDFAPTKTEIEINKIEPVIFTCE